MTWFEKVAFEYNGRLCIGFFRQGCILNRVPFGNAYEECVFKDAYGNPLSPEVTMVLEEYYGSGEALESDIAILEEETRGELQE